MRPPINSPLRATGRSPSTVGRGRATRKKVKLPTAACRTGVQTGRTTGSMATLLGIPQATSTRPWPLVAAVILTQGICGVCAAASEEPPTPEEATTAPAVPSPAAAAAPSPAAAQTAPKADDHSQFHGSIELNNQYSAGTEPLRTIVALSYSNLFSKQDELSALYEL